MTGLEHLVEEVRQESENKARKVKADAEAKAKTIVEDAEKQAAEIISKRREAAAHEAEARQTQVSAARLKSKQIISEEKDKAVCESIKELERELAAFACTREYRQVFARLAKQASANLGQKEFDLLVNKRDLALAKSLGYSGKPVSIIGGGVAASKNGLIRVNNSFDSILEEKGDLLRMAAFEELFGPEGSEAAKKKGRK